MNYLLNPLAFTSSFSVPSTVVENYIKIAGAVQLRVLLFALKNLTAEGVDPEKIGLALNLPCAEVQDALSFWVDAGIFTKPDQIKAPSADTAEPKKAVVLKTVKPTRSEIAKRGAENEEIAFLLREAQNVFGRALKQSEASTLVWLYDDEGMCAALVLTLLEYAKSNDRLNIGFIERTGVDWINNGVLTVADADKYLNELARKNNAWKVVQRAFGIDPRMPSKNELTLSDLWVNDYKLSRELLREAYNACVDATGKLSMPYIKKIIEGWRKAGVKTVADIENATKPAKTKPAKNTYSTSDMNDFDKFINKGD